LIQEATQAAPKAVVNVDDSDVGGATVEHSEQRGDAAEAGAEPTLVGTAITGTATRPPTTLGNAPSIPATQMMRGLRRVCWR